MKSAWQGRLLVGTLLIVATAGCNPFTALAYLVGGGPKKVPPEFALTPDDGKKEVKVLVLTSCSLDLGVDLIGVDRMLASEFAKSLTESCKANKQKLTVIPTAQVEKYKQDHPGTWRAQDPPKIGKHFDADYVIDLEILSMSLYKEKAREFLHGRVVIGVAAFNLNKPDEEPRKSEYEREYPRGERPVHVSDKSPSAFRLEFVQRIAAELVWKFSAHEYSDHVTID